MSIRKLELAAEPEAMQTCIKITHMRTCIHENTKKSHSQVQVLYRMIMNLAAKANHMLLEREGDSELFCVTFWRFLGVYSGVGRGW